MLWSVFAILAAVIVLFWTYMAQSARNHARKDREEKLEKIRNAETELERALVEHPEDCDLHATLKYRLKRLRAEV